MRKRRAQIDKTPKMMSCEASSKRARQLGSVETYLPALPAPYPYVHTKAREAPDHALANTIPACKSKWAKSFVGGILCGKQTVNPRTAQQECQQIDGILSSYGYNQLYKYS